MYRSKNIRILSAILLICITLFINKENVYAWYGYNDFQYVDSWSGWHRTVFPVNTKVTGGGKYLSFTMHNVDMAILYTQWSFGNIYADRDGGSGLGLDNSNWDEILNGEFDPESLYMFLDFGFFTSYMPQLKSAGYISPNYQLPSTYYSMASKKVKDPLSWAGYGYAYTTNCDFITQYESATDKKAFVKNNEYIPKFILDANGATNTLTIQVSPATTYNGIDYSAEFDAQFYFDTNSDLQSTIGPDGQKLLEHYVTFGKSEGRLGKSN